MEVNKLAVLADVEDTSVGSLVGRSGAFGEPAVTLDSPGAYAAGTLVVRWVVGHN